MTLRPALLIAALAMAGCTDPHLYAGIGLDSSGVTVSPALSGTVGGATVTVSP